MTIVKRIALATALGVVSVSGAAARDQIQIAGSSTVLPYAAIVAEIFAENFDFPTPVVEGGGSGAGRKKLCEGVGETTIDIATSSSRITKGDLATCKANGVDGIMEVRIGYDGIVFASDISAPAFDFTAADWYDAIGARVMKDGRLVANPNRLWSEVDAKFPPQPILAFIPGTKHGTREVFDSKVIEAGCRASGAMAAYLEADGGDAKAARASCLALRTDGVSVDIDGDYSETLARVAANKEAFGVFGLSYYENNTDKLRVATIDGVVPSARTIAAGSYPVSRPLYFYVKTAHLGVIPGLQAFIDFFVSDEIAGPDGPLAEYGLVSDPALGQTQAEVAADKVMGALN